MINSIARVFVLRKVLTFCMTEYAAKHELTTTQTIQKGIDLLYQMPEK